MKKSIAILAAALFPLTCLILAGEFWEEKAYQDWTDKQTQELLKKSPWSQQVMVSRGAVVPADTEEGEDLQALVAAQEVAPSAAAKKVVASVALEAVVVTAAAEAEPCQVQATRDRDSASPCAGKAPCQSVKQP